MQIITRRKTLSERSARIILCTVLYVLLAGFIGSLFLISVNYQSIYDSPEVENGKADFEGINITSRGVACTLAGEWEFFYNQWIVTDGFNGQPDGMINLPAVWTGKDFGNGKLPKSGYASYRIIVENIQPDIFITVYRHNSDIAYRVFINGELNVRSGTVSKNAKETKVSGRYDEKIAYHTDGSPIEIVVELSACKNGGLNAAMWLNYDWSGNTYGSRLRIFTHVALGISITAVAVSVLSFAVFKFKRDFTVPAFMSALFIHFVTSKDMMYEFALSFTAARLVAFFSAALALALFIFHLKRCGVQFGKKPLLITGGVAVACAILLFILYGTPYAPIPAAIMMLACSLCLIPVSGNNSLSSLQRIFYCAFFGVLMSVFCAELCDGLGLLVFGTEFYFSVELMFMLVFFTAHWLWKMAKAARTAMRVSELEYELSAAKHQALQAQIKPHFVFNSLTAIQDRYRSGLADGDKALEQFARHLRLICDSDGEELIPFDSEIKNALNYFELENLRAGGKINMLLDTEFTDFSVPVLSLQPLVENAVRHGELRQIKDGCIQLSSKKSENGVTVTVSDNGKGFDTQTTREGVGLENTRKRFEMLGAKMSVISSKNAGTQIIIEIPLE